MLIGRRSILSIKALVLYITVLFISLLFLFISLKQLTNSKTRTNELTEGTTNRIGLISLNIFDISVAGHSANNDQVDLFYVRIRKDASSSNIRMHQISILLELQNNTSQEYLYMATINCSNLNNSSNDSVYYAANYNRFGAEYLVNKTINDDIISKDDIVELCFKSPQKIFNSENVILTITPGAGKSFTLDVELPETFTMNKNKIYSEGIGV
jgi:archaellin